MRCSTRKFTIFNIKYDQTIGLWDANGRLYHGFDTRINLNNTIHSDKNINRIDQKERLNRVGWHPMGRHFIRTLIEVGCFGRV